jgi:cytosine deaminase
VTNGHDIPHAAAPDRTLRLPGVGVAGLAGRHDIVVKDGVVADVVPAGPAVVETGAGFVTPLLADAHVHLDKTHTIARIRAGSPAPIESLFDAIALMEEDRPNWTAADIRVRASRALEAAFAHGVGVVRSHVDWVSPDMPAAWPVLCELRKEWKGRVDLQIAALLRGDLVPEAGAEIAAQVRRDEAVFGAFFYRNADLATKVGTMFALAAHHDLKLDFHVDEGLEREADGLSLIIDATARFGMAGRVLCGHACSLSLRSEDEVKRIVDAGARAGVGLVVLPTTNLHLQDRGTGRTPRLRGLAPLKEARAAGMDVMIASDNVGDAFYPYGDYDPLSVLRLAVPVAHLEPDAWLDSITSLPARWCGSDLAMPIAKGMPADFIWHAATDMGDLISRPRSERIVYRRGAPLPAQNHDWRNA